MLSEIGLILALYVITRYLSFLLRKYQREEHFAVKIISFLFLLITIFLAFDLLIRGLTTPLK